MTRRKSLPSWNYILLVVVEGQCSEEKISVKMVESFSRDFLGGAKEEAATEGMICERDTN